MRSDEIRTNAFSAFDSNGESLSGTQGLNKIEYFTALALQGVMSNASLWDDPARAAKIAETAAFATLQHLQSTYGND